jgi:hypothetical protein
VNVSNKQLLEVLAEIRVELREINTCLTKHVADDAQLAQDVRQLAKQRGFISGAIAATVAIASGVFLAAKWLLSGGSK